MRFSRGVVKIPIKYLYVFLIVASTAFFLYLHILNERGIRGQGHCRVTPSPPRKSESKKIHDKSRTNRSVCGTEPEVVKFEDCPHCFRPTVQNLSSQFYQVQYSTSMFPRGPPDLFKPRNEIQQDLITDYLITPSLVCNEACPYLVAILLSVTDAIELRTSVRATWASAAKTRLWPNSDLNADIQVLFVLGHQTEFSYIKPGQRVPKKQLEKDYFPTLREWARIKSEADRYGDILYLNMQDSYYNLTLKVMSAYKWLTDHCARTKFFLKVDTDTFVHVPLLLDLLIVNEERLEYSVLGRIYTNDRAVRRSEKWGVDPQVYPIAMFPIYASGSAHVISAKLLSRMVDISPYMPLDGISSKLRRNSSDDPHLYETGVLGLVLSYDYFTTTPEVVTDVQEKVWFWCDMIHDRKVLGKLQDLMDIYKLWRSFFRYYGTCWKEIPELANPKTS